MLKGGILIKNYFIFITCLSVIITVPGCDSWYGNMKNDVTRVTKDLQSGFQKEKDILLEFKKLIIETITNPNIDKIDISKMDEKNGGQFYLFNKIMYGTHYKSDVSNELFLWSEGTSPLTDLKKKKMMAINLIKDKYIDLFKKSPFIVSLAFVSVSNVDIHSNYPYFDLMSILPPSLDFSQFDWFKTYVNYGKDKVVLIPPTISLVWGIVQTPGTGIYIGDLLIGEVHSDYPILSIFEDEMKKIKSKVFITYKDGDVFGASRAAKEALGLKLMLDYYYVKQLKENPRFSDDFKLTSNKQGNSPDIRKLADLLKPENAGKDNLTIIINNRKYRVYISEIKENGYFIVGLE